jgi:hypothetical protein
MSPFLRRCLVAVACVAIVLLLVRFAASPLATYVTNRRLAAMPQFQGHVEGVQLSLWRGTIGFTKLELTDRAHPEDGVIVAVAHGMLSLSLPPFFRGRVGGEGAVEGARVIMVKRLETPQDEQEQAKKLGKPMVRAWQEVLTKEFPIELSRIEVEDSAFRFDDRSDPQAVSLELDQVNLTAAGFSNREKGGDPLPATLRMTARIGGSGSLLVGGRADPAERQPRFEMRLELKGLSLPKIHDFLVRYALVDVSSGEFDLYTEVTAANGQYDGYTKPFFKDLKFEAVPDPEKSLLRRAATKVASVVQGALKNERGDVATKAPFHGDFDANQVDVWVTVENLLRNAFIQALREGLEGQTPTPNAET